MIDPREIFQQYRAERRHQAWPYFRLEMFPHLSRHIAELKEGRGIITFADLKPDSVLAAIQHEIACFHRLQQDFEWKVYDFDSPPDLRAHLHALGFVQEDQEAFLVLESDRWQSAQRKIDGLTIERITDPAQLPDFVAAEQAIWPDEDIAWRVQQYANVLVRDRAAVSIYCAYLDGKAVGTGRVTFPKNSRFAELNGGGVRSDVRGRGIFTALLTRRIEEARSRGFRWIAVDAAPMSRPILLRKGFQHVCWTYPMAYHHAKAGAVA